MTFSQVTIFSDRLKLVPISEIYAEPIFHFFTPEITKYMYPKPAETIGETLQFISKGIEGLKDNSNLQLVILKKDTDEFLGCIGVHKVQSDKPELGLWLKKESHGNHYGVEAIHALANWARKHLIFSCLVYPVDKRNIPSRKIPESMGGIMVKEEDEVGMGGNPLNIVYYEIPK